MLLRGRKATEASAWKSAWVSSSTESENRFTRGGRRQFSIALEIQEGTFQSAPLDVWLRTLLAKLNKELAANEARVTHDKLPRIPGNPDRLMQVFENLVRNAVHYRSQAPPLIHITAARRAQSGSLPFAITAGE